jgi:DNA-binding transcriptional LysR family regulator
MASSPSAHPTAPPIRVTLEQWLSLVAVVETGGYAQAAEALHKSQSSVTYAVQKIEELLDLKVFEIQGRKAVLTPTGHMLYRRARTLIDEAEGMERAARKVSVGWESEITLAVEIVFPMWLMLDCLNAFGKESPQTRIELYETVIGGTSEALLARRVDMAISPWVPAGFVGELLLTMKAIAVAHPDHPLHKLGREVTPRDLRKHRHLVVRDSGTQRDSKSQTIEGEQRWTVSNISTSIGAACRGYGFAWYVEDKIRTELAQGLLKQLPLRGGGERPVPIYLIFTDRDAAGPGLLRLAEIIREQMNSACREHAASK